MHLSDLTNLKFYWDFGMTINLSRYIPLTFGAVFKYFFDAEVAHNIAVRVSAVATCQTLDQSWSSSDSSVSKLSLTCY
mgnify:CR=1 FL=1